MSFDDLSSLALTGTQVLDTLYAKRSGDWTSFRAVYNGDEEESWAVIGIRYVDLDHAPSYHANVTLFGSVSQTVAHAAVEYLEKKRTK